MAKGGDVKKHMSQENIDLKIKSLMEKYGHYLEKSENITENLELMNYAEKVEVYGILRMMQLNEIQGEVFDKLEEELPEDADDKQIQEAMEKHLVKAQEELQKSGEDVEAKEILEKLRAK